MKLIETYPEMQLELQNFMINNATRLPDHSTAHWLEISVMRGAIDKLLEAAEMLYAIKSELNNPARILVAQIFSIHAHFDVLGVNKDDRAQKIIIAMRRDLDEPPPPFGWPSVEDDPAPLERYLEPESIGDVLDEESL